MSSKVVALPLQYRRKELPYEYDRDMPDWTDRHFDDQKIHEAKREIIQGALASIEKAMVSQDSGLLKLPEVMRQMRVAEITAFVLSLGARQVISIAEPDMPSWIDNHVIDQKVQGAKQKIVCDALASIEKAMVSQDPDLLNLPEAMRKMHVAEITAFVLSLGARQVIVSAEKNLHQTT